MESHDKQNPRYLFTLSVAALGVVYGDIGTSPLYAFRECFMMHHGLGVKPTHDNVLGILSLITWALTMVISVKYLVFVMRADNRGEGGILALMALVRPKKSKRRGFLLALGIFGAALLYGDGMIGPAITSLSAFEGLEIATPVFRPFILPLTIAAIICLFTLQKIGTGRVGIVFGPLMLVWFTTLATLGVWQILQAPHVLAAVNPLYGIKFLIVNKLAGFLVLGAVFLVVTGGESLYADMGHFGAKPIRLAWFFIVFPSLLMNYYGQGALLLRNPAGAENPFFHMAPTWARYPLVALAATAAIIASQAVIAGSFSLTRQAVQLGFLPRMKIRHTSEREIGQIYIPSVNWILMFCAIGLVVGFKQSTALAGAYGVAVTTTMAITTILLAVVARERWRWPLWAVIGLGLVFMIPDLAFFGANIVKISDGGWFPLAVGLITFTIMTTWRRGRQVLNERMAAGSLLTVEAFVRELANGKIPRVPGTAIFMSRLTAGIPTALLHNLKHNKVVHDRVVFLTVDSEESPRLSPEERHEWQELGQGVYRLSVRFGFMEDTDIPALLGGMTTAPVPLNPMTTSYFLGRETLIPTKQPGMAIWREHLFVWLMRNSTSASQFFNLPANQVIELGAQVEL